MRKPSKPPSVDSKSHPHTITSVCNFSNIGVKYVPPPGQQVFLAGVEGVNETETWDKVKNMKDSLVVGLLTQVFFNFEKLQKTS